MNQGSRQPRLRLWLIRRKKMRRHTRRRRGSCVYYRRDTRIYIRCDRRHSHLRRRRFNWSIYHGRQWRVHHCNACRKRWRKNRGRLQVHNGLGCCVMFTVNMRWLVSRAFFIALQVERVCRGRVIVEHYQKLLACRNIWQRGRFRALSRRAFSSQKWLRDLQWSLRQLMRLTRRRAREQLQVAMRCRASRFRNCKSRLSNHGVGREKGRCGHLVRCTSGWIRQR